MDESDNYFLKLIDQSLCLGTRQWSSSHLDCDELSVVKTELQLMINVHYNILELNIKCPFLFYKRLKTINSFIIKIPAD